VATVKRRFALAVGEGASAEALGMASFRRLRYIAALRIGVGLTITALAAMCALPK